MDIIQIIFDAIAILAIGGIGYWLGRENGEGKGYDKGSHSMYKHAYKEGYNDAKHNRDDKIMEIDDEYDEEGYLLDPSSRVIKP